MTKCEVLISFVFRNRTHQLGDVVEFEDEQVRSFINRGLVRLDINSPAPQKEPENSAMDKESENASLPIGKKHQKKGKRRVFRNDSDSNS